MAFSCIADSPSESQRYGEHSARVAGPRASVLRAGNENHPLSLILSQGKLIAPSHPGQNGQPQHVHFFRVQLLNEPRFLLQRVLGNGSFILGLALIFIGLTSFPKMISYILCDT